MTTTTTIQNLTHANVRILSDYRDELTGLLNLGATTAKFYGNAAETLVTVRQLKDKIHATKGGRSFENRAIVAVVNKLDRFVYGDGDKSVKEVIR